ncbi:MAG: M13 family metallopeptidase [Bacteroidales bacterium]|nr:M13 family metallopeptidase [Bacteroidales bacterium]
MKTENENNIVKAIDLKDLDTTVSPSDDFYQFATGGWQKNHPLPDEESRFGSFDQLGKDNNQKINDIITNLSMQQNEKNSIEWKIATLYNMGMDTSKFETDKFAAIEPIWSEIDNLKSKNELPTLIAKLHREGFPILFGIYGAADSDDANMTIANLYQSGLGLANRDYYTETDQNSKNIQVKYHEFIEKMLTIANFKDVKENVEKIYKLEENLAQNSMTNVELRDPFITNNKTNIEKLTKNYPNFNFNEYFNKIGVKKIGDINVMQPKFFENLNTLLSSTDIEILKVYMKWVVLRDAASWLNKEVVDANFDFYGKFLSGAKEQQPRWRKIVNVVNGCLGEAVGQMFVKEYFPPESKQRMETLVKNIQTAFSERIKNLDWMSEETKTKAQEKLNLITVKIGYPDKWKNYSILNIAEDYFFCNIMRANEFEFDENIAEIGFPVDKTKWLMTPQTVNAYYQPQTNEICFPAGILQPPFFYADADDAVNYGAIGVVIGHEMTHGFDDEGRNFDKDGNLNNWWQKEDSEKFETRAQVLVDRFDEIVVLDELHANGQLSLGENIADYGGLKISFDALKKALNGTTPEKIDGFTAEQRFYLAYAKVWGQNIRNEEIIRRTKEDVHAIGKWRVNAQLQGIEDFFTAFDIKENTNMRLPKDKWAYIW